MQVAVGTGEAGHPRLLLVVTAQGSWRGGVPGHGRGHGFHDRTGVAGRGGQLDYVQGWTWMRQSWSTPAGESVP